MFVPTIKNQVKIVAAIFGITLFSSIPVGVLPRAFASPVTSEKLIELTNQARTDNGLTTLVVNSILTASAQGKVGDMLEKNYFAHTSPEGLTPWYWFKLVGYDYIFAGENLAKNYATAEAMFDAWMASPTHRANILSENYKEIGIAIAGNSEVLYATSHFGARAGAAAGTTSPTTTLRQAGSLAQVPDTAAPEILDVPLADQVIEQGEAINLSLLVNGDPVQVVVRAGEKSANLVLEGGRWTGSLTLYAGGTYTLVVEATDAADNTATSILANVQVELPELIRNESNARTLIAAYWKDVATHEGAPIAAALVFALIVAAGFSVYTLETRRLGTRLATILRPALTS